MPGLDNLFAVDIGGTNQRHSPHVLDVRGMCKKSLRFFTPRTPCVCNDLKAGFFHDGVCVRDNPNILIVRSSVRGVTTSGQF